MDHTSTTASPNSPPRAHGESEIAADLVRRIGLGDPAAESELVERYSRGLASYLRRLGCAPDVVDDLHQDCFRVVLERLRTRGLDDPTGLAAFLRGTARNLHLAERRKAWRRPGADDNAVAAMPDPRAGQLRQVLDAEAAGLVRRLLGEMGGERDREILYRFYVAEEPKEEIRSDLGLSSLHFNRVLFRARQRFKELLSGFEKRERLRPHAGSHAAEESS